MAAIHETIYPRLRSTLTPAELIRLYTPTAEDLALTDRVTKGPDARFTFCLLFKTFQCLGSFIQLRSVPTVIVQHLAQVLGIEEVPSLAAYDASGTRRRHVQAIRDALQVRPYDREARRTIIGSIAEAAAAKEDLADLINIGIAELFRLRYELPGFTTLDKIAQRVRAAVYRAYYRIVFASLGTAARATIDQWLITDPTTLTSPWQALKQDPDRPSVQHLRDLADRLTWFDQQAIARNVLAGIPDVKVARFAAEARTLDAARMKDMQEEKRYTLAVALYIKQAARTRDDLAEMLIKRIGSIHKQGKADLTAYKAVHQERTDRLISTLRAVVVAYQTSEEDQERLAALTTVLGTNSAAVLQECDAHLAYAGNNYYAFLWPHFKSSRAVIMRLLTLLTFTATTQDQRLEQAIRFLRMHLRSYGRWLTVAEEEKVGRFQRAARPLLDLSWIPDGWWRLVTETQQRRDRVWQVNRRQFEVCLISQIVAALKTGDLAIDGGDRYADQRTQLISWEQYQREIADYGQLVKLPTDGQAFTAHVQQWLEDQVQTTDAEFPTNAAARFERGRLMLRRLTARPTPPGLAALHEVILNRLQPTTIVDALADTLAWLAWSRPFGPISGFDDKLADPSLRYLITVFCYGCQLGPAQTARALRNVDRRQISWINQRHVTIESLDQAIEILVQGFERFALPLLWGSPKRAAADGTKWDMYEQNLLAEQHIRYGGVGGIGYYHVASTCIAIFSNFIACGAWEGTYILDFFEQYAAITQPDTIHADTQGQTAPLFGLAYLMGVTLIPRIRNWQDLTMYRASATSTYVHIDSLFTEVIDWRLIATHLPDMLQIVLSIKAGSLTPSTVLRTLNSENQHNLVYRAFRELGRAIRTKTLLHILADVDLRHTMQDASNKNEAFNRFTKWVAFGSAGVITENDREEQRKFVKYNHLVSNCLIVYNTAVLTNILHELAAEGYSLDPAAVAALSPYLQRTIDRFGRYEIDPERPPSSIRFDIPSSLTRPAANDGEPPAQA